MVQNGSTTGSAPHLVFAYVTMLQWVAPRALTQRLSDAELDTAQSFVGSVEVVRDGVLEAVQFPVPDSVRRAADNPVVDAAVSQLLHSTDIARDAQSNKLRDFVRTSAAVLDVVRCQDQLWQLTTAVQGAGVTCGPL